MPQVFLNILSGDQFGYIRPVTDTSLGWLHTFLKNYLEIHVFRIHSIIWLTDWSSLLKLVEGGVGKLDPAPLVKGALSEKLSISG